MNKSDLVENNFQQDLNIINNEIRSFIASLYKFFATNTENCDHKMIMEQMSDVLSGVEVLLYKIEIRRHERHLSFSELVDSDIHGRVVNPNASSYMTIDTDPARTRRNTNSNLTSTINSTFNENTYGDLSRKPVGRSFAQEEKIQDRDHEKGDLARSLNEGLDNLIEAAGNLRRAQPFSNIHGLFNFEE